MNLFKILLKRNKILTYSGSLFLVAAIILGIYSSMNSVSVLGINSMFKPIKFTLSTWIYSWTLAYLLFYVNNQQKVKWFSYLSVFVMLFENSVIIVQALKGKLSHFNQLELVGGILYALMGVLIVWLTTATLFLSIRFITQKTYSITPAFTLSIKIGLIIFVIFSFFGGYMSVLNTHHVGGEMGKSGLPFLNWSTLYGDLRVAHFFGIHSLQIIPLAGWIITDKIKEENKAKKMVWLISFLYFLFISALAVQSILGLPFLSIK